MGVGKGGERTGCDRVVTRGIAAHGLLDDFVGCEVDCVCGSCGCCQIVSSLFAAKILKTAHTCSQYYTRQPSP